MLPWFQVVPKVLPRGPRQRLPKSLPQTGPQDPDLDSPLWRTLATVKPLLHSGTHRSLAGRQEKNVYLETPINQRGEQGNKFRGGRRM